MAVCLHEWLTEVEYGFRGLESCTKCQLTRVISAPQRLETIQKRLAERDDSNAYRSACGEYNCECHYDIPFLLSLINLEKD